MPDLVELTNNDSAEQACTKVLFIMWYELDEMVVLNSTGIFQPPTKMCNTNRRVLNGS